jgi:hypothetical protein
MRGGIKKMPSLAKAYIATIAAVATALLSAVAYQWNSGNPGQFVLFFALAMLASAGIALFSFGETVVIGFGGALVQSLWNTQQRPKPVQVLFNAACLTVCTAAAYWTSHSISAMAGWNSLATMMVLGACVYVILNTGLVSLVISLAEGRPLKELWSSCYEWTFPYFLVGAAVAGLAAAASHGTNLAAGLLIMPVMYFVYLYYKIHIVRAVIERISSVSQENEAALAGVSHGR